MKHTNKQLENAIKNWNELVEDYDAKIETAKKYGWNHSRPRYYEGLIKGLEFRKTMVKQYNDELYENCIEQGMKEIDAYIEVRHANNW